MCLPQLLCRAPGKALARRRTLLPVSGIHLGGHRLSSMLGMEKKSDGEEATLSSPSNTGSYCIAYTACISESGEANDHRSYKHPSAQPLFYWHAWTVYLGCPGREK